MPSRRILVWQELWAGVSCPSQTPWGHPEFTPKYPPQFFSRSYHPHPNYEINIFGDFFPAIKTYENSKHMTAWISFLVVQEPSLIMSVERMLFYWGFLSVVLQLLLDQPSLGQLSWGCKAEGYQWDGRLKYVGHLVYAVPASHRPCESWGSIMKKEFN